MFRIFAFFAILITVLYVGGCHNDDPCNGNQRCMNETNNPG